MTATASDAAQIAIDRIRSSAVTVDALKRLHQELNSGSTVFDNLVEQRAAFGGLLQPVGQLTPIKQLLADWPARIVCPAVCP